MILMSERLRYMSFPGASELVPQPVSAMADELRRRAASFLPLLERTLLAEGADCEREHVLDHYAGGASHAPIG